MRIRIFLLLFSIIILDIACDKNQAEPKTEDIFGFWRYQSGFELPPTSSYFEPFPLAHIELKEGGNANGFTSRNFFEGSFKHNPNGQFQLDVQMTTRVADTPWSGAFLQALGEIDSYSIEGNKLSLIDSETNESYVFLKLTEDTCMPVINDENVYNTISSDEFRIREVTLLDGTCLEVLIEYGGGCKGIDAVLMGSAIYLESNPPQLGVKIVVDDDDHCEALVKEYFRFDLKDFQYEGSEQLILNLKDWDHSVTITY